MLTSILSIGTAVPQHILNQQNVAACLANRLGLDAPLKARLLRLFMNSKIEKRHTVLPDYLSADFSGELFCSDFPQTTPGTSERNAIYKKRAPELALEASKKAIENWQGNPKRLTHVISVSCTGMFAPGIEFYLIDRLGLSRSARGLGINFMGCFGAFRGIAVANAFAKENSEHRVLVVCTELCSLHLQKDHSCQSMISNALFSDGAAAVIIGKGPEEGERPLWEIHRSASYAMQDSEDEMTWEVGNYGFKMKLTEKVPIEIKKRIRRFSSDLIAGAAEFPQCHWAVHPGGKAILCAIAQVCSLNSEIDLRASWEVLRNYGNMSSATFLFVLEQLFRVESRKEWSIGLGFGPGLTLEGLLLKNVY